MPRLIIKFKDVLVKEYVLEKTVTTIGRKEDNDVVIDNMSVSGHHARIEYIDDNYKITDLGSTNGSFVNGKKVASAVLKINDWINMGSYIIYFK